MTKKDIQYFKTKLEKEKDVLEAELKTVGKRNPDNPKEWEASTKRMVDSADENEVADKMEQLEENEQIMGQLEKQLMDVDSALDRIEDGTYGVCEIGGDEIEKTRLEANPSARTCKKHMK